MPSENEAPATTEHVELFGPFPFTTCRVSRCADGALEIWRVRRHRKGLVSPESVKPEAVGVILLRALWMPRRLNWWIGVIFAFGALLFASASVVPLSPAWAARRGLGTPAVNVLYFAGSIPFTIAAYLQLHQAANATRMRAGESKGDGFGKTVGWMPNDVGWLSCALQLAGAVLFNVNTGDALIPSWSRLESDLLVWAPNLFGSILFLASGYLAFIEACHGYWAWRPTSNTW